jgi:hypothetical protein
LQNQKTFADFALKLSTLCRPPFFPVDSVRFRGKMEKSLPWKEERR